VRNTDGRSRELREGANATFVAERPAEHSTLGPRNAGPPASSDDTTTDLVVRAAQGDQAAWDQLVERYSGVVWAVARSFGLDGRDAGDVFQTTWLRLVENVDRIREPERIGAWLATTARRESLRLLRLAKRVVPTGDEKVLEVDGTETIDLESAPFLSSDRDGIVTALLAQLSPRQQMVLRLLTGPEELSYQEISEVLDIPIGSIGPTRARALDQLRRLCLHAGITEY